MDGLITGEYRELTKRGLSEETCRHFGYQVGEHNGAAYQIAPYYKDGQLVAQKLRSAKKTFSWLGTKKGVGLFGENLWRDGGKMVVVTEGEIDAMSVSQLQNNKWPVVSVQDGAAGAKKSLQNSLEWLEKFDSVVLMLDQDEAGEKAIAECAPLFTPGKCKVARLPLKDANLMLTEGRGAEVINAIWGAKVYRPDGIVSGAELWESIHEEDTSESVPYPWEGLNGKLLGARRGELVTITAGSGIGKSAVMRELLYAFHERNETVGAIMLEESVKRTALGFMGLHLNVPLHITREGITEAQMKAAFDATLGSGRIYLYDHFGSTDVDNLLSRIRYMVRSLGCKWIVLDHISIVISGQESGDERRNIDVAMTKLRTLVQEAHFGLFLVSHLKRPEGRGHEQGAQTSLSQLRGSHAIAQLSDAVVGLERDQQGDNPNITTVRVLKNRYTGETGVATYLKYDRDTGRLEETEPTFGDETSKDESGNGGAGSNSTDAF